MLKLDEERMLTPFHKSLIICFLDGEVRFVLIGGHAALIYGSDRTTGDMDLFVDPTASNGSKIMQSFLSMQVGSRRFTS